MKFTLKDYQSDAVLDVLTNLRKAARRWHEDGDIHAFALSATTGAGKTVMAAAAFEALFHGDDDYNIEPDPGAVVLWFSDDPSLNEQTRFRLLEASDRIGFSDLVVVPNTFNEETFAPGKVYFLNTQKLGRNSLLTRGHDPYEDAAAQGQDTLPDMRPDGRTFTIWDTIRNTIENPDLTLYLVLDEAHRGIGSPRRSGDARSTIVERLINGDGPIPPVPVVWGISATVERFKTAMADVEGRSTLPDVTVDTTQVQESGLLKDTVVLDIPDEAGHYDTVLLRRATEKLRDATDEWTAYANTQGAETVIPLMVLQVPNTPNHDDIGQALSAIFDTWPELPHDAVAHVFGEHTPQNFGAYAVPYLSPERVQESAWARVLIAKDAISTGWDCPRAEVMVSFRPAKDRTHITQLLGRMVRTPLARRIPGNEKLNAVSCILPFFDTKTVTAVANAIMHGTGDDTAGEDTPPIRRVLVNPIEVKPNPAIPDTVWDALLALPSQSLPKRTAKPVKRLTALAHELAADGLLPDAGKQMHSELHTVLDAARARYADDITTARSSVLTVEGTTLTADLGSQTMTFDDFVATADRAVIDNAYRQACRVLSPDVARTYAESLADQDASDTPIEDALLEAHATVAALGLVPEVKAYLEEQADKLAGGLLNKYRVGIKELTDDRQDVYRQLREMSTEPQDVDLAKPAQWLVPTAARQGDSVTALPRYKHHLLCNTDSTFPADVNGWETDVLDRELARPNLIGWYRNPPRSSQDSLSIAYEQSGRIRTLRPDFVFFTARADGTVTASIVDPHGHHLGDALPKLRGLADYAEHHADHYQRIDAVAKVGDTMRVLDLTEASVRAAVAAAEDATSLYQGTHATDY